MQYIANERQYTPEMKDTVEKNYKALIERCSYDVIRPILKYIFELEVQEGSKLDASQYCRSSRSIRGCI